MSLKKKRKRISVIKVVDLMDPYIFTLGTMGLMVIISKRDAR